MLALLNQRSCGDAFIAQIAQQIQDRRLPEDTPVLEWLGRVAPHLAEIQTRLPAEQAADNLSTSSAITSLRSIGDADWPEIVAETSVLIKLMVTSPAFAAEREDTRDQTLHAIEALAKKSGQSERVVATRLLAFMHESTAAPAVGSLEPANVASYWLRGAGQPALLAALGLPAQSPWRPVRLLKRYGLALYLGSIALATAGLVAWLLGRHSIALPVGAAPWITLLAALLMVFPASEAVVAVVNRIISESSRPERLPRLALAAGIPAEDAVLVVIPAILSKPASAVELAHQLQLHYLANPESNAQFGLLTDWSDAAQQSTATDAPLLAAAVDRIDALNRLYPSEAGRAPRFVLLHRERRYAESEQRWMGWERKRGKLEQLLALLADGGASPFIDLGETSRLDLSARYVLTLDSDTRLPPGRLRELMGVATHPHNRPVLSADGRRVERGYGILQPHVATPLPIPEAVTLYHWLFSGQSGIDPYSIASSEVYQDLFGEGTYTGKGLLHVQAVHSVLGGRLPESQVLSHDLLEGSMARCAAVTDVSIIEEAPFHADVAASRVHRWTRGDWQLLPFLLQAGRYSLRAINRWKILDNLRRSLVAPTSLALLCLALGSDVISPLIVLLLIALAFTAGPLMGALAGFSPSRDDVAYTHFYRQALEDLGRAVASGAWLLAQLLSLALMAADAIVRAIFRMLVSHRDLLEWQTAAAAQASASIDLRTLMRKHWGVPAASAALYVILLAGGSPHPLLAGLLCALWALSPVWTWWVSRPRPQSRAEALSAADRSYLERVARESWRLFERCVGPEDHHLPPDNLQTMPSDIVAHRTSPTNIGLYLLSAACAQRFGWIGRVDMLERMEATLATLERLERYRGHFFNWYDTRSAQTLLPLYVSTVDSGNLCMHLLAVAQACTALADAPAAGSGLRGAVMSSVAGIEALRRGSASALELPASVQALLQRASVLPGAASAATIDADETDAAARDLAAWRPAEEPDAAPSVAATLGWAIDDLLALLESAHRDTAAAPGLGERLRGVAATCQRLAGEAEFSFLYSRKRRLFHIGYRVAEHQLDASYYDLLASEARSTSLWAIAKGDVPAGHWAALGRPFYALGDRAGLRSWSGSMFEYLMPTLVLDEPHGSVLRNAAEAAVLEQIAYGRERHVPWGISECAYAASDHTLAYQYAPQGVPRLALRRTSTDELVIAPYATALALQVLPHRATANLRRLEAAKARGRYGFIEALDYSPARQVEGDACVRVRTFMAHHQGMSIVALANVLLDREPRRWGMSDPRIEAVASLLHERAPREVPNLREPPSSPAPSSQQRRAIGMLRSIDPGSAAIGPTHLLSNGHYAVALRANGAGASRSGGNMVTRARDDALRDSLGWFFFLRWDRQPQPVSLTQHPAPDRSARYDCSFHADRVVFGATWAEIEATTTVWVSPEDDIEFRRVVLHNSGDRQLDLELMSSFEVTLADARADEAHPAFSNLFITAEWQAGHEALIFERKPRLPTDKGVLAASFLAESHPGVTALRVQVDRQRWLGRNRTPGRPIASLDLPPSAEGESVALDTGLDPVAAFGVRVQIAPRSQLQLTFCTAAADSRSTLRAVIDKYRQTGNIERASMMSATLTGIRLREMRINADSYAAIQTLTTTLALTLTRAHARLSDGNDVCDRRLLWRFGISGDRPILLVSAGVDQGFGLLRSLAQALRLWSWGGLACDLVVVNHEPASYVMTLARKIAGLREAHLAASAAQPGAAEVGFHVLQATDLHPDELSTLRALARVRLNADGRPLVHHVQELTELHDRALAERQAVATTPAAAQMGGEIVPGRPSGDFAATSGEFRFDVSALLRPARPWVNVLANPGFGTQLSEAGGGYSWAVNSRLNMLTPWSNDPVADPTGEWLLLQDLRTEQVWSVTPSAAGDEQAEYRVAHGQGYSVISHRRGSLEVNVSWCVDPDSAVKQVRVRLVNRGHKSLQLRLIGIAEWIMGANRGDRGSTHTRQTTSRLPALAAEAPIRGSSNTTGADAATERRLTTLYCSQRDRSAGFGGGTGFFALASDDEAPPEWTCDRRESFDARGRVVVPDSYAKASGCGLDPCAAIATRVVVRAGESADRVFLLGFGPSYESARALADAAARVPPLKRLQRVRAQWDELLDATVVRTPDPLFDAMVNRWLLYQTVACRLWAKAGFYQAGGAYGYRDQLQDSMALAWTAPSQLRQQIVLSASRQFAEGDVQHWWHAPTGAGVRTHFSDDLLWLPYACLHYVQVSGDAGLYEEPVAFLEGAQIPPGAEDAYYAPGISEQVANVYEHAARAIDRSTGHGAHGLPLMGTGDWNDGMNRVGHEGRGESVWLAWFLCDVVQRFAPVAEQRGEAERAGRWRAAADGWKQALERDGWDGAWYRRAFFDDGTPLGTEANAECKIDLIAQAWAVLSGAAPEAHAATAMASLDDRLIDREAGLIRLLDPPLCDDRPSAGYIQAYPPGVRENGGQYSHAGVWALMAQAARGDGDAAYRYFTYLSPAHRSRDPAQRTAYAIEPYVMAGDVYTAAPYVGRGGWSWYTGSAAWMHRAAIESMFGLRVQGDLLSFEPCLPRDWPNAELSLTREGRTLKIVFARAAGQQTPEQQATACSARLLSRGETLRWSTVTPGACCFVLLGDALPDASREAAAVAAP